MYSLTPTRSKFDENTRKFITSRTVNILNNDQQEDIHEELRILIEQCLPDLCQLHGEPLSMNNGTKFYCTIKDILTSDGHFWVEREFSSENERKFRQLIDILSLVAVSYHSLEHVHIGQLVALHYQSSWHRALVISKNEQFSHARVRLVDYGSALYVNIAQLKWLPEQFYFFPFKAVECVFSEAVKPTFSDTIRLTFKQLVYHRRLHATVYDRENTRLCIVLKCSIAEGIINVYRYLRAHEHRCAASSRLLSDGEILHCLHPIIGMKNISLEHSMTSPIRLTHEQLQRRRAEIEKLSNNCQSLSTNIVTTPMPCLSFAQQ